MKRNVELNSAAVVNYTGCLHPTLRTMSDVEVRRLRVGDTFPDIDTLKLRFAEEANLQGIGFMTTRSKVRQELTSRGKVKYDKVFSNISSFDFTINVSEGLLD